MQNEIQGETILLRSYRKEDAGPLFEAGREASRDTDFGRWMPWCHPQYSRQESESFIGHCLLESVWRETPVARCQPRIEGHSKYNAKICDLNSSL